MVELAKLMYMQQTITKQSFLRFLLGIDCKKIYLQKNLFPHAGLILYFFLSVKSACILTLAIGKISSSQKVHFGSISFEEV